MATSTNKTKTGARNRARTAQKGGNGRALALGTLSIGAVAGAMFVTSAVFS